MIFIFKYKRILSYLLIIPVIISLSFSSLAVKTVYAVEGAPPVPVADHALRDKFVGQTVMGYTVPGFSWNALYNLAIKTLLAQITDSIVNWINSGFEGSPSFVTDPQEFLLGVGDEIVGEFIDEMTTFGWLCDPYRLNIRIALSLGIGSFQRQRKCTLTAIIKNFDDFVTGTFKEGGWEGWLYLTTNPNAHPGTAYLSTQAELQKRMREHKDMEIDKLNWGRGFMSWRTCEKYKEQPDPFAETSATLRECEQWSDIKTPGAVIAGQIDHTLGTNLRQLELADDIDKIVGALVSQLVMTVLQKGLSSMNFNDGWEGTSRDLEQKSEKSKMISTCSASTGSALTGETVEWTVYVSGGSTKKDPVYKWSGNEIVANTETEGNVLKIKYDTPGTKKASVIVTKGDQTNNITCNGSVDVSVGNDLCFVDTASALPNQTVKWSVLLANKNESATYNWISSDTDGPFGTTKVVYTNYTTTGVKSAGIEINKGHGTTTLKCANSVRVSDAKLSASCEVDPIAGAVDTGNSDGTKFTWTAVPSGGTGNYSYDWSGTDGLTGNGQSTTTAYTREGNKTAQVTITSNKETITAKCGTVRVFSE